MAAVHKSSFNFAETRQQFEQNKPGGLRSFVHRRNNSDSGSLSSSFSPATSPPTSLPSSPPSTSQTRQHDAAIANRRPMSMAIPNLQVETNAMGHWHQSRSAAIDVPRSPTKTARDGSAPDKTDGPRSPTKSNLATLSARFSKDKTSKDTPQTKPKKTRSSTNLRGLLSRPKSDRNLSAAADKDGSLGKNKENRKPSDSSDSPATPIFAQFCRGAVGGAVSTPSSPYEMPGDPFAQASLLNINNSFRPAAPEGSPGPKQRPKSFQPQHTPMLDSTKSDKQKEARGRLRPDEPINETRSTTWAKNRSGSRARVMSALTSMTGQRSKAASPTPEPSEPQINPQEVDKHLEALLDRRNIPENQRYKMRNLNSTIKMEFIRQDWAESEAKKLVRPSTNESDDSAVYAGKGSVRDANDKKHTRGRSFTFSRNSWRIGTSPSKGKKKDVPIKGHTRNKSAESVVVERPVSSGSYSGGGIIAKVIGQHPSDFVNYLRKVQRPEAVEVGKLHKLRLLLRNERVAWTEDFIKQGGMKEIVGLLQRIMEVEWR